MQAGREANKEAVRRRWSAVVVEKGEGEEEGKKGEWRARCKREEKVGGSEVKGGGGKG